MKKIACPFYLAAILGGILASVNLAHASNLYAQFGDDQTSGEFGFQQIYNPAFEIQTGGVQYLQFKLNILSDPQAGASYYCPVAPNTGVVVLIYNYNNSGYAYQHCITSAEASGKIGIPSLYTFSDGGGFNPAGITGNGVIYFGSAIIYGSNAGTSDNFIPYMVLADGGGVIPKPGLEILSPEQYQTDGSTIIPEGGTTIQSGVVFGATLRASETSTLRLQVEVEPSSTPFANVANASSAPVIPGSAAIITVPNLSPGSYHWQARIIDSQNDVSPWETPSDPAHNIDFTVEHLVDPQPIELTQPYSDYKNYGGYYVVVDDAYGLVFASGTLRYFQSSTIGFNSVSGGGYWLGWECDGAVGGGPSPGGIQYPLQDHCAHTVQLNSSVLSNYFGPGLDAVRLSYGNGVAVDGVVELGHGMGVNPNTVTYVGTNTTSTPNVTFADGEYIQSGPSNGNHSDTGHDLPMPYFDVAGLTTPTSAKESASEPVVIVPGIFGSVYKNGQWIMQPVFKPYDALEATLVANGYIRGKTLFDFPYDWEHASIAVSARELAHKIQQIKSICGCTKVNIIAHSMGGLVARQYVESGFYQNDVDQLIFLGTPHMGAPLDYLAWEGGTPGFNGELDLADIYLDHIIYQEALEAGFGPLGTPAEVAIFDYIRSSSSPVLAFQELLPTYDYLRDTSGSTLRSYPRGYPDNAFLDDLNASSSLAALGRSGVKVTNIYSNEEADTVNAITVMDGVAPPLWSDGMPKHFEMAAGDGTVPAVSVTALHLGNAAEVGGSHLNLPTTADGEITTLLTGNSNPIRVPPPSAIQTYLTVIGLSPVDLLVTAPDGSHVGEDFSSGQEVNQINGAYYSGTSTTDEYITIPDPEDGQYTIRTQGTRAGDYHILVSYGYKGNSRATSSDVVFAGNTLPGLAEDLSLSIHSSAPRSVSILPQDTVPPTISHGTINARNLLHAAPVRFDYSATDAGVGVLGVTSTLDGAPILPGAEIDFNVPGDHTVIITAADRVGNATSATVKFNVGYQFGGFLPPIQGGGSGMYRLGRTLPVKFKLTDANDHYVSTAVAKLVVEDLRGGMIDTVPAARPATTAKSSVRSFRYDASANQYIYNFDTDGLTAAKWQIKIELDDGNSYAVPVSLK